MKQTARSRKEVVKHLKTAKVERPTCGDCIGLHDERIVPKCKGTCSVEKGYISSSKACKHFSPNTNQIKGFIASDKFESLAQIIQSVPQEALSIIASTLYIEKHTRKIGFKFGQKVYVRYRGGSGSNYLSNFMIAYVFSANEDHVRVVSREGNCSLHFKKSIVTRGGVIYTVEEFDDLRDTMVKKGKYVDPDTTKLIARKLRAEEEHELNMTDESASGQITTIDTVFKENKVKKGKKQKIITLVDIVEEESSGFLVKDKKKVKTGSKKKKTAKKRSGDQAIEV